MKLRWPFVRRSTHAAAIDAQLRRHHIHSGDLHDKLNRASAERNAIEVEYSRSRADFDEVVARLRSIVREQRCEILGLQESVGWLMDRDKSHVSQLGSFGHVTPHDWAAPLPCWASTVVVADYNGVRGTIAGMPEDPTSDDPRVNLALPMGLEPT